jgi:hypothetical protein
MRRDDDRHLPSRRVAANTQRRSEAALQHKLDAIADGLADLMEDHLEHDDVDLHRDVEELKEAVGCRRSADRASSSLSAAAFAESGLRPRQRVPAAAGIEAAQP